MHEVCLYEFVWSCGVSKKTFLLDLVYIRGESVFVHAGRRKGKHICGNMIAVKYQMKEECLAVLPTTEHLGHLANKHVSLQLRIWRNNRPSNLDFVVKASFFRNIKEAEEHCICKCEVSLNKTYYTSITVLSNKIFFRCFFLLQLQTLVDETERTSAINICTRFPSFPIFSTHNV